MKRNPFSLEDKRILVTGASSGIGRRTAIEISNMGGSVVVTGRDTERLRHTFDELDSNAGQLHIMVIADLTREEDLERISEECGELNGVVHCAGIGDKTLLRMVREKDIDRIMDVNFKAPALLQKLLLKKKRIQSSSSIVFIASRAPMAPLAGNGLYSASKGALIAYSRVLAQELASRKIRVNCICPAMVLSEFLEKEGLATGIDYEEKGKAYPLGRYGLPKDIAYLAVYLLSDASEWITGSSFDATGGSLTL